MENVNQVGFFHDYKDIYLPTKFSLPPEVEKDNIEYKYKLKNLSEERIEELATQMNWRLTGTGNAFYEIGVEDDGSCVGLSKEDLKVSLRTLGRVCKRVHATIVTVREIQIQKSNNYIAEVWIRQKLAEHLHIVETRIAVLGDTRVGKSTLIGVFSQGELDDGRGKARLNMLRHRHEILTGRTSSMTYEVLGFDESGNIVNQKTRQKSEDIFGFGDDEISRKMWGDILKESVKVVSLIDLAGHEKYVRSTLSGFMQCKPDYALVVISALSENLSELTKEHFEMSRIFHIPIIVALTKVDLVDDENLLRILSKIERFAESIKFKISLVENLNQLEPTASLSVIPIVPVSCTDSTHKGLEILQKLLFNLPKNEQLALNTSPHEVEFLIEDIFEIYQIGIVVAGKLNKGFINANDQRTFYIGPDRKGDYRPIKINSIHCQRVSVNLLKEDESGSLAIFGVERSVVRKGMIIVSSDPKLSPFKSFFEIEAEVSVLSSRKTIFPNHKGFLHIGAVKQAATLKEVVKIMSTERDKEVSLKKSRSGSSLKLTTPIGINKGDRATVNFKFSVSPEYVTKGSRLLFRDGNVKIIGFVTQIIER
ncbi:P-loop containing nucleoside triphosphate hydrolase protein [Rozella allomycis CSF55]|uniref:P-loop containing nucleoside triphosphate hydrolase protein n=1 Tax=Rozella allomycis (strain CSF55) TaxID=988480 RepID=A0A4P9YP60_ROZAC|nr:P-loop containing nucleoside triphosphate hydrolase protein [Rozella allomycis CSF55]